MDLCHGERIIQASVTAQFNVVGLRSPRDLFRLTDTPREIPDMRVTGILCCAQGGGPLVMGRVRSTIRVRTRSKGLPISTIKQVPWLRVTVEGVVIVASILLAFVIDASWDERQATDEEAEIVAAVVQDLRRSRDAMDVVLSSHDLGRVSFDAFLATSPADLADLSEDSAAFLLQNIYGTRTLNLFDGAIRGTDLSQISDLELRNALGDWSGLAADHAEAGPVVIDIHRALWQSQLRAYPELTTMVDRQPGIDLTLAWDSSVDVLAALRRSREYVEQRTILQMFVDIDVRKIERLRNKTDEILALAQNP